jgi:hypothetical protein
MRFSDFTVSGTASNDSPQNQNAVLWAFLEHSSDFVSNCVRFPLPSPDKLPQIVAPEWLVHRAVLSTERRNPQVVAELEFFFIKDLKMFHRPKNSI